MNKETEAGFQFQEEYEAKYVDGKWYEVLHPVWTGLAEGEMIGTITLPGGTPLRATFQEGEWRSFQTKKTGDVSWLLHQAADLFEQRNPAYGNSYERFGGLMLVLFPEGLPAKMGAADWARLGVFTQCVSKIMRYANHMSRGGHRDSAKDLTVYGAMLEKLTEEDDIPF